MPIPLKELKESCDICALPRCRTESIVTIWLEPKNARTLCSKQFGLCEHHWLLYCDSEQEPEIRKQLRVLQRPAKENRDETHQALVSICSRIANTSVLRVPPVI